MAYFSLTALIFSPIAEMTGTVTLFPAILLLLSLCGLLFLKTTRRNMTALTDRLEKRRKGEETADEDLKALV